MTTELVMGERYLLKGVESCMYFGVDNFAVEGRELTNHIFACKVNENPGTETSIVYSIPTDQIQVDGMVVRSKKENYPCFRQEKVEFMFLCNRSMRSGLENGIKMKIRERN